jgi:hypothetical protein
VVVTDQQTTVDKLKVPAEQMTTMDEKNENKEKLRLVLQTIPMYYRGQSSERVKPD